MKAVGRRSDLSVCFYLVLLIDTLEGCRDADKNDLASSKCFHKNSGAKVTPLAAAVT